MEKTKGAGRLSEIHFIPKPYTAPPSHECASKPAKADDAKNVITFSPFVIFSERQKRKR